MCRLQVLINNTQYRYNEYIDTHSITLFAFDDNEMKEMQLF